MLGRPVKIETQLFISKKVFLLSPTKQIQILEYAIPPPPLCMSHTKSRGEQKSYQRFVGGKMTKLLRNFKIVNLLIFFNFLDILNFKTLRFFVFLRNFYDWSGVLRAYILYSY